MDLLEELMENAAPSAPSVGATDTPPTEPSPTPGAVVAETVAELGANVLDRILGGAGVNPPAASAQSTPEPSSSTGKTETAPSSEAVSTTAATGKKKKKTVRKTKAAQFIVLTDCLPFFGTFGEQTHLDELLLPVLEVVQRKHDVPHWGLIEFGQGGAAVAQGLDAYLTEAPFHGVLLVDSFTPAAKAVKEILNKHADIVVRGLR